MALHSMTGFGRASVSKDGLEVVIETSSVNRKNLDLAISLPRDWSSLEKVIADEVKNFAERGRVNLNVQIKEYKENQGISWDDEEVSATLARLKHTAIVNGIPYSVDSELLFQVAVAHKKSANLPDAEEISALVTEGVRQAMTQLKAMRAVEGEALGRDLLSRNERIRTLRHEIEERSKEVVPQYRETLMGRLRQLGLELDLNDERVLKEISIFADRCDITEELTRLDSHLQQFSKTIEEGGVVGRKLDFLLQEINREYNTIGSKANNVDIAQRVMEAKNEIERIREQVQNLE